MSLLQCCDLFFGSIGSRCDHFVGFYDEERNLVLIRICYSPLLGSAYSTEFRVIVEFCYVEICLFSSVMLLPKNALIYFIHCWCLFCNYGHVFEVLGAVVIVGYYFLDMCSCLIVQVLLGAAVIKAVLFLRKLPYSLLATRCIFF